MFESSLLIEFKHVFNLLLSPLNLILLLFLLTLVLVLIRRRIGALISLLLLFLSITLTSVPFVSLGLLRWYEAPYHPLDYSAIKALHSKRVWVVVLGGGHKEVQRERNITVLSNASRKRLEEGFYIYKKLPRSRLVLTGSSAVHQKYSEAESYRSALSRLGVPRRKMIVLDSPRNTDEEIALLRNKNPGYVVFVSSASHMRRIEKYLDGASFRWYLSATDHHAMPEGFSAFYPSLEGLGATQTLWHEIFGFLEASFHVIRA